MNEMSEEIKRLNIQLSASGALTVEKQKEAKELRGTVLILNSQIATLEEAISKKDEQLLVRDRLIHASELTIKSLKKDISDIFDLVKSKNDRV